MGRLRPGGATAQTGLDEQALPGSRVTVVRRHQHAVTDVVTQTELLFRDLSAPRNARKVFPLSRWIGFPSSPTGPQSSRSGTFSMSRLSIRRASAQRMIVQGEARSWSLVGLPPRAREKWTHSGEATSKCSLPPGTTLRGSTGTTVPRYPGSRTGERPLDDWPSGFRWPPSSG